MPAPRRAPALLLALLLLSLPTGPSCGGGDDAAPDPAPDANHDAHHDAVPDAGRADAARDAAADVLEDLGHDAHHDALADAGAAVDGGAGPDARPDGADAAGRDGGPDGAPDVPPDVPPLEIARCLADPPAAAQVPLGLQEDGTFLTFAGRAATPAGPSTVVEGFPSDVVTHPTLAVAYVTSASSDDRRLLVLDLATHAIVQDLNRGEAFQGLAVAPDGGRLYASAGAYGRVDVYGIDATGALLQPPAAIETGGYPGALALSPDGATLWVGQFDLARVIEVDTATLAETRRIPVDEPVFDVVLVPERAELYTSGLGGETMSVVDLGAGAMVATIDVPTAPAGLAVHPDGSRVWAAVAGADVVAAVDTAAREVVAWVPVATEDLLGPQGAPLPNSNVNALAWDGARGRLYAARGADNAVSVLDGDTLAVLGALPAAWYPTALALTADGATLVVADGKGGGAGPSLGRSAKNRLKGSVTFVDLDGLDLAAATAAAAANYRRSAAVFPFECDGPYPVPATEGERSPIEHVILIVKENKTFDCVLGDLEGLDVAVDPSLVRWGEELTPNLHALVRTFVVSDNFHTDAPNSDTGHLFLTATHLTEFVERMWLDDSRLGSSLGWQITEPATPQAGNLFTHLMDHGVPIRIYGEIVGMFEEAPGGSGVPFDHSDRNYPGGPFVNYDTTDEAKARYVADRIAAGELAAFTFLSLPNDHTVGTQPGRPTPESMVADNDYATGLVVDALSRSPFWPKSAVFILEDDPQGCEDHVEAHRSFLVVASPWVRRGHVSHVHASFITVLATIERILGVPPLGRPDASVALLWDLFTFEPDPTPYDAVPRRIPPELNRPDVPGAAASMGMDFRSPDRNPDLAVVLDAYRLWRMGRLSRAEADRRIAEGVRGLSPERRAALEEEAEEEPTAFDADWRRYEAFLAREREAAGAVR